MVRGKTAWDGTRSVGRVWGLEVGTVILARHVRDVFVCVRAYLLVPLLATALAQVHRALVILEPVETDVDSLKALLTVDKGPISKSRGECTAKPLPVVLGKEGVRVLSRLFPRQ